MVCYVSRVIFRRERRMVWLERSWYDFGQCERSRVSEGGFDASRAQKPNWTNFSRATPKSNWSNISRAAKPNYTNISRVTKPYHLCMSRVTKSYHLCMSRVTKPYYLNTSRVTKPYHLCISWVANCWTKWQIILHALTKPWSLWVSVSSFEPSFNIDWCFCPLNLKISNCLLRSLL